MQEVKEIFENVLFCYVSVLHQSQGPVQTFTTITDVLFHVHRVFHDTAIKFSNCYSELSMYTAVNMVV